jgi:hypothetical protein
MSVLFVCRSKLCDGHISHLRCPAKQIQITVRNLGKKRTWTALFCHVIKDEIISSTVFNVAKDLSFKGIKMNSRFHGNSILIFVFFLVDVGTVPN